MRATEQGMSDLTRSEFTVTRRGYDRHEVEERIQLLVSQLSAAERARQQERTRAETTENQLKSALAAIKTLERQVAQAQSASAMEGFGERVEKLLRLAEQEAAEIKANAAREASAGLQRARAEAETHRRETEQSLVARTATLEEEATQRQVELDERERQLHEQLAAAHEEAEQVRLAARREAEALRGHAEQIVRQERERIEAELAQLRSVHGSLRAELARIHQLLTVELSRTADAAPPLAAGPADDPEGELSAAS